MRGCEAAQHGLSCCGSSGSTGACVHCPSRFTCRRLKLRKELDAQAKAAAKADAPAAGAEAEKKGGEDDLDEEDKVLLEMAELKERMDKQRWVHLFVFCCFPFFWMMPALIGDVWGLCTSMLIMARAQPATVFTLCFPMPTHAYPCALMPIQEKGTAQTSRAQAQGSHASRPAGPGRGHC